MFSRISGLSVIVLTGLAIIFLYVVTRYGGTRLKVAQLEDVVFRLNQEIEDVQLELERKNSLNEAEVKRKDLLIEQVIKVQEELRKGVLQLEALNSALISDNQDLIQVISRKDEDISALHSLNSQYAQEVSALSSDKTILQEQYDESLRSYYEQRAEIDNLRNEIEIISGALREECMHRPKSCLLTSYYDASNDVRALELRNTLQNNVANPFIDQLHIFVDPGSNLTFLDDPLGKVTPVEWPKNPERDRFGFNSSAFLYMDFFEYANLNLAGDIVILTNGDIELDETAGLLHHFNLKTTCYGGLVDKVYAISRINFNCSDYFQCGSKWVWCRPSMCDDYRGSHDAFVFVPPLVSSFVENVDHPQDRFGAENAVIYELIQAGYEVVNPCPLIRIHHRHCVRDVAAYLAADYDRRQRVDGPWTKLPGKGNGYAGQRHGRAEPTWEL